MAHQPDAGVASDGGSDRDWPLALLDIVEEYGHVPHAETVADEHDDVDDAVLEALNTLHENAGSEDITVDELVLELKRINSVTGGIPNEDDVEEWHGAYSVAQFDTVFGSVENAVEFAFAARTSDLTIAIDDYYTE